MRKWQPELVKNENPKGFEANVMARVLCLVDSDRARASLEEFLGGAFEIDCAPTILLALQILKKKTPDAIVVQLHLEKESCFDFLRAVENNSDYAGIPVITCCIEDVFDKQIEEYLIKVSEFLGSKLYVCCNDFYSARLQREIADCIEKSRLANTPIKKAETA